MSKLTKFYFIASYLLIVVAGVSSFRINSMLGGVSVATIFIAIINFNVTVLKYNSLIKKYSLDEVIL